MITQTTTLTKNDGTIFSDKQEAIDTLHVDCSLDDAIANIRKNIGDGLLTSDEVLTDAKTGIIITRQWDDDAWTSQLELVNNSDLSTIFKTSDPTGWRMESTTDNNISYSS